MTGDRRRLTSLHLGMGWFPDQAGGLNRYVRGLVEALSLTGADAQAIILGPVSGEPANVAVAANALDPLARQLLAFRRRAGHRTEVDVVDAHFALYAVLPVRVGSLRGHPLIVHFHGPWAQEGLSVGDPPWVSVAKYLMERALYSQADEFVVLSRAFGRVLVEEYGVSPWRVNVIPPGVDLGRFSPGDREQARLALGLPADAWIALTVRRLVPRMGIDVLLDAWGQLPLDDGILLIVGDGPLRPELERDAPANVRFLGEIDDRLLPVYYRAANTSVIPSRSLEGFGLVALEALGCGTPVVVTDVGGLPEAVAGLQRDLIIPCEDAGALAGRLASAVSGSKPLPSAEEARAHAERFTWRRAVERHEEVYTRAVSGVRRLPLRVVFLDHTAALSGGELALLRLLPALEGVDAHVVLAEDGPLVSRLEAVGISVQVLPMRERTRTVGRGRVMQPSTLAAGTVSSGFYSARLARLLRRLKPDLVHTNSLKAALYGGVAGRLAGVPVIWHIRDRIAPDYLGEGGTRIVRSAARLLPAAVIANSRSTLTAIGVDGNVIPSPIVSGPAGLPNLDGAFTAGIVGRVARWKGQDIFVEGFARAFPNGPERAVVIGAPLFGADDQAFSNEVQALAARPGLDGRVTFTGFVEDVPAQLARLDVLVHASVLPEPFGQVVVEGMAAGLPVVASRAGGPAEVIEDGVNGFLVSPGDVASLADTLVRLAREPDVRAAIGARARLSVKRFEPEVVAAEVVKVYRQTLSLNGRR